MSVGTRRRGRAKDFADLERVAKLDADPEDDAFGAVEDEDAESGDSDDSDDQRVKSDGREHYAPTSKSRLRATHDVSLGPRYVGARVARGAALNGSRASESEEDDDDEDSRSDEGSSEDMDGVDGMEDENVSDAGDDSEDLSMDDNESDFMSDEEDSASDEDTRQTIVRNDEKSKADREELRRLMSDDRQTLTANVAKANEEDATKGRAVIEQRETFDQLLHSRIKLQQGVIAMNSLIAATEHDGDSTTNDLDANVVAKAEDAAVKLWTRLTEFREEMHERRTGTKRKRNADKTDISSDAMWQRMQDLEVDASPYRRQVLQKWSARTQTVTVRPQGGRLNQSAQHTPSITDVIDEQLVMMPKLAQRTRQPRSCAPVQARDASLSTSDIYDDADFYGALLKDLLERRNADADTSMATVDLASRHFQDAKASKIKRTVDTKASKGRKMRFTVQEKLLDFLAPEDRTTWGDRQREELFAGLLGQRAAAMLLEDEDEQDQVDGSMDNRERTNGVPATRADEALKLFQN